MTKEDAIDIIKSECYVFNPLNFDRSTMVNTALDMAVKALKQETKPMVEIDLYSVIKQKYIEREVLDKIRAEIERQEKWLLQAGCTAYNVDIALDAIKSAVGRGDVE